MKWAVSLAQMTGYAWLHLYLFFTARMQTNYIYAVAIYSKELLDNYGSKYVCMYVGTHGHSER